MDAPLRIIVGPTASGKSALAVAEALRLGGEVVSADSMQIYQGMEIGTGQPTAEERRGVPHHLLGCVDPGEPYNAARFAREARSAVDAIRARGRVPIVCGGTGLFIRVLTQGIFEAPGRDESIRRRLEEDLARDGYDALRARLAEVDPVREAQINANDAVRVVRALEVFELAGRPMSELLAEDRAAASPIETAITVLDPGREELAARIDARIEAMLAAGWLAEARRLMERRLPDDAQCLKALGCRELFAHLRGECSLAVAVGRIRTATRQFAKRQRTWFRGADAPEKA